MTKQTTHGHAVECQFAARSAFVHWGLQQAQEGKGERKGGDVGEAVEVGDRRRNVVGETDRKRG